MKQLLPLGIALVLLGMGLIFLSALDSKNKVEGGGVVLLGPFPIVFGSSKETVFFLSLIAAAIIILYLSTIVFARK